MSSPTYQARAAAFAKAIDLGIAVYTQHPPRAVRGLPFASAEKYAKESRFLAEDALAPEPAFANTKSLAYLEDAFFTFWNESHGPHIEAFWSSVAAAGLPFQRRDIVGSILERGSIRTRIEYEHAVDAEPDLAAARRAELARLIGEYEQRSGAKARRASASPLEEAAESTEEVDRATAEPTTEEPAVVEAAEAEAPKRTAAKRAPTKRATTKKAAAEAAPVEEVAAKKVAAKKPATKKVATKKPAAKRAVAKKAATTKVAAKKPAAKKAATKKVAAKKPAAKKAAAAKKAPVKKVAARKAPAKKVATKKVAATKKVVAKKPAAKKAAAAKKAPAKKVAAKKAPAKKVATKKARR